jgi:hypothetical protein
VGTIAAGPTLCWASLASVLVVTLLWNRRHLRDQPGYPTVAAVTASGRNPAVETGRVTAAVATIDVPITDANQLGPMAASASR